MTLPTTMIVLAYKQENFIAQAVDSALAQNHTSLEVLLSDDNSPDATWEIMQERAARYKGPHTVTLSRMEQNAGLIAHFGAAVKRARGDVICYLAGDDIAQHDRAATCTKELAARPGIAFVESAYSSFTQNPLPSGNRAPLQAREFSLADYTADRVPRLSSSTRSFRASLFSEFPDLDPALSSEDTPSALRLLMRGNGLWLNRKLLFKRVHGENVTGPAGIKKIDFDMIREQYLRDIEYAQTQNFISPAQTLELREWAHRSIERRKLRLLFDLDYPDWPQMKNSILPSDVLNLRSKFYAFRRFIKGVLLKP